VRQETQQRWFSRRAFGLHTAIVLWVPGCLFAFWWQVTRAFDGNGLSYLYSVEWPAFAVVGVWGWWLLLHTDPDTVGRRAQEKLAAQLAAERAAQLAAAKVGGPSGESSADPTAESTAAKAQAAAQAAVEMAPARRREDEDEALAAYNDRLADLATRGPKTWRSR